MSDQFFLTAAGGVQYGISGTMTIGSDRGCQVILPYPEASSFHATIWLEQGRLFIRDENSFSGTLLNGTRLAAMAPHEIVPGSQIQIGSRTLTVTLQSKAENKPRKNGVVFAVMAGLIILCFAGGAVGYLYLRSQNKKPAQAIETSPGITVVRTSEPASYLSPEEQVQEASYLAVAVAALNNAQGMLLLDLPTADPAKVDSDLVELATQANDVAGTAREMAFTAAQYVDSAAMENIASQYYSIARLGYVMVIQAQNLREGLAKGNVTREVAAARIEEYAAVLWNPETASPQTGLLPDGAVEFLKSEAVNQVSKDRQMETWLATTDELVDLEVMIPVMVKAAAYPGAEDISQANGLVAVQAAASNLTELLSSDGETSSGTNLNMAVVPVYKNTAITNPAPGNGAKLPTFAAGKASLLSKGLDKDSNSGETAMVAFTLMGAVPPIHDEVVPIKEITPAVTLKITSLKETSRAKTDRGELIFFDVQVTWHSIFQASALDIGCYGGTAARANGQDGSIQVNASGYVGDFQNVQISCRATRPADFVSEIARANITVNVASSKTGELVAPTETPTSTPTQTLTPSPTVTLTPTIDKTQNAMGTEAAAEKTAEFNSTITAIAQQTQQATQSSIITLNGTFGQSEADSGCSKGIYSSGTLNITANFAAGTASGTLTGGGSASYSGLICGNLKYDISCNQTFTGTFSGGLDAASGAVNLSGSTTGSVNCTFSNCSQDGVPYDCSSQSDSISNSLTLTGTILKESGTGNGSLQACSGCSGSWTAGK